MHPIRLRRGKFLAIAGLVFGMGLGANASAASAAETTVSLTFKDTLISQYSVRQVLTDNDVDGTFYVNSGLIANRTQEIIERMSWKQVNDLAIDGNEIGGGSRSRLQLDLATPAELTAEICDDRTELIRRGYAPVSFGYTRNPDDATAAAQAKVEECGYASARGAGGLGGAGNPVAESIPPANAFNFRARSINENHALATIKSWVTSAESTGGWLPLVIHSVCNDPGCSITPANFQELVEWLKDRETLPGGGTHVKTVREVMTGTTQPTPPDPIGTTISLAFDDALDEHSSIAGPEMVESGVRGTFFLNSGKIGTTPAFMTWAQARTLNSAGHEMGGQGINDINLAGVPPATLNTEVCQDRLNIYNNLNDTVPDSLENAPVSFAYSFGAFDAAAKQKVANVTSQCTGFANGGDLPGFADGADPGYLSGRAVQGLKWYTRTNRCQLLSCKFDEAIHPADPYELKVIGSVGTDDTLDELKQTVENIYNSGGGWGTFVIHEICPGPDPQTSGCPLEDSSTTPEIFEGLTDWLADSAQTSRNIQVKTFEQVMEGAAQPRPPFDDDDPVTAITCNAGACGTPHNSNGPVTVALSGSDTGPDSSGLKEIRYAINGVPTGSSPIYTGPFQVNSSATVRFRASDNYGNVEKMKTQDIIVDQTAPTSSILCNAAACNTHYAAGTVNVTLSAVDPGGTGVANIHYTTDGSEPTIASPTFTGSPIPVSVTTQVRFRAVDNVDNLETPAKSQTIRIDGAQPQSSVLCDGSACQSTFYGEVVQATLSATDLPAGPDASGVKNIRYTTDGSEPNGTSPIYTGAIPLSVNTTLKFRAEDNVGNVESPVHTQQINVDIVPAVSTITCDGAPCSPGGYDHVVRMELAAASSPPGSAQPTEIRYTTDGSTPNGSSTLYTGEFFISETSTVKFFSLDEAGNVEPVNSQLVRIDLTPPVSAIHCNGPAIECQDAYNSAFQVHLSATDVGGGGAAEIRYTTDGSAPTASSTLYTGPFNVSGNGSHTIRFFAKDFAGNVESPDKSRTILIETDPPTSAIQCNGSPCIAGFYNAPVTGTLSANDGAGSGVKNIRFTTDGSPVTGSSQIYTGSFMINGVTTVRFRAEDNAGNLETQNTQVVNVDTQEPTTAITCDTDGPGGSAPASCLTSYPNGVDAVLDAVDAGASGIDEIRYTTNGSDPTGSSTLYTGPIDVDSTTLLKWRAEDNAGNVESPIKSRNIIIDTVDPTLTTTCNGVACIAPDFDDSPVSLALNGADTGGSGLNDVRYTTDGSAPNASSTLYSGPIALNATTTVRWRVSDNAGRVATGTQQVNIDQIDPTSTIQCNAAACITDPPYTGPVTVALNSNDTGGSGLDDVRYTLDGSVPTASSTLYTAPFVRNSSALVRWRVADNAGNVVLQQQQVTIDADGPETTLQCNGSPCSTGGYNAVVRMSFQVNSDADPTQTYFTIDGSTPTESAEDLWDGQDFFLDQNTTVRFFSVDNNDIVEPLNSFVVEIDTDAPTSSIECNGGACQDFYNAAVSVSLEGDDGSGGGIGEIRYTTDGSAPNASSTLYTAPFNVSGNGAHTVRWFAKDNAGNVESPSNTESFTIENQAPTTTAACNGGACGGFFNQNVNVALTANDAGGAGVKEIRYTTDGTAPNASSTLYTAPIPVSSSTLVRFRAEDNAGNVETVKNQQVNIDTGQPNSTIECNGAACVGGSAYYNDTVSVELDATDSGDSGVNVIRYTTDGSNPTGSSTVYSGAFDVAQTSTVKFRAEDNAGNVESPVNSQEIKIESGPPVSSIQCNGGACQNAYNAPITATLSATDDASGVDEIRYTTDGSEPNGSSTLYTGTPIPVNATTTIKFFANDVAGEIESPAKSRTIVIDNAAPASGILCNGAPCGGPYKQAISATITASDTGGAGVKEIRYTTDGSNPTAASPLYAGPIPVSKSTEIKFRAEDNAGNLEATKTQSVDFQNVLGTKCKKPKNKKNKKAMKKFKKCKKKQQSKTKKK